MTTKLSAKFGFEQPARRAGWYITYADTDFIGYTYKDTQGWTAFDTVMNIVGQFKTRFEAARMLYACSKPE